MSAELPPLEHLRIFVFGPGYGECIAIQVPPGDWIVIDGCTQGGTAPVVSLLDGEPWACVALTHPHEDHIKGLDEVLALDGSGPVGAFAPFVDDPALWSQCADGEVQERKGLLEQVVAAIQTRWEEVEGARWELTRGSSQRIGEATLVVLHPEAADHDPPDLRDCNAWSSAMVLQWKEATILLGADVEHAGWEEIASTAHGADLGQHALLKVPHHGSDGANHEAYAAADRAAVWIATPWNKGVGKLPRFEGEQGIAWLLGKVDEVHLTGLPRAHRLQHEAPCRTTRAELLAGVRPEPLHVALGGGVDVYLTDEVREPIKCYVEAEIDAKGRLVAVRHGPGSVVVTEA